MFRVTLVDVRNQPAHGDGKSVYIARLNAHNALKGAGGVLIPHPKQFVETYSPSHCGHPSFDRAKPCGCGEGV